MRYAKFRTGPALAALLSCLQLVGCGGGGDTAAAPLSVSSTSLANGQIGHNYSSALAASGGTPPLSWALTRGTLPAGLKLDGATGILSGQPTVTAAATPLTFKVTDSSTPTQTMSTTLALNISPANITVSVSPARAGITVTQSLKLQANTNDNAGVSWSATATAGSFAPATSLTGSKITYTAPAIAGAYTLTATSLTDSAQRSSITVGVTDLAGVFTYHNDLARSGANTREYALTAATVKAATFGKLFACSVDGAIYAQPLWVANLAVSGTRRNVVFVATQHDSLYAFDADASPCQLLWKANLLDTPHGGTAGETSVPSGVPGFLVGQGTGSDIAPEVGVTGTPVIDPATQILYVVSKSVDQTGPTAKFYQRLHAIDLATGTEKAHAPKDIAVTYPSAAGTTVDFDPTQHLQRPGLCLVNGHVYIAWAAHDDRPPWYGWIAAYSYDSLSGFAPGPVVNVAPNVGKAGIWMSGGAPSADSNGNLYVLTGNGTFDATSPTKPNNDFGDSFLQLSSALAITSWFTPSSEANDNATNGDFGAGGAAIVLNLTTGSPKHLVAGGGKDGTLYLLDGDAMGGYGDAKARQYFSVGIGQEIFATAAFWNNTLYLGPVGGQIRGYAFNPGTGLLNPTPATQSTPTFPYPFPGTTPSISAAAASGTGILWSIDSSKSCTSSAAPASCGPAVLHAYSATSLDPELWSSATSSSDTAGNAVKFAVPTVANGKVYVGTRGSSTGAVPAAGATQGELDVYGLKPN